MPPTDDTGIERIRSEKPVSNTFHNLVQLLNVKLDSAARYGLYEQDAYEEGYRDCAQQFARLAERDRQSIAELLECVRLHVGDARTHSIFSSMSQD